MGAVTSVNWPVGLGGKGNEGVAVSIQQTRNSIGYITERSMPSRTRSRMARRIWPARS